MAVRIRARRDTAANWTSSDPTLLNGELGYETDTHRMKVGDGSTAWVSLGYVSGVVRDTAANFTSGDPTLGIGVIGFETDTGNLKVGDGSTAWTALAYVQKRQNVTAFSTTTSYALATLLPKVGDVARLTGGTNVTYTLTAAAGTYLFNVMFFTSANVLDPAANKGMAEFGRVYAFGSIPATITPSSGGYAQGYIERIG